MEMETFLSIFFHNRWVLGPGIAVRILQRVRDIGGFKNDVFSGEMYFLKAQKTI